MNPILEVKNLKLSFKTDQKTYSALRDVSFHLNAGETLGIVGESGCGKTALVKTLLMLHPSHSTLIEQGQVLYMGQDLLQLSEKQWRETRGKQIGMVFQDPMSSLNPSLKIGFQIAENFKRKQGKLSTSEIQLATVDLLKQVGILEPALTAQSYPHQLSGGMRQRAMIALVLAADPAIIIADEPTTALDVTVQAQILDLLKTIQRQKKKSMILISHDLSVVAGSCDRVLVMYAGKIVEQATVEQLFRQPSHPYTVRLLQSIPSFDRPVTQPLTPIHGAPPDLSLPLKGCAFCARCTDAMPICQTQDPPFFTIGSKHQAACWKYDSTNHS
jgi:oligopeptide transport system ATP-binding protein